MDWLLCEAANRVALVALLSFRGGLVEVDLSLRAGGDRVASGSAGFAVVPVVWSWDGHRREKCRLVCASQRRATQRAGRLQSFVFRLFAIITVIIVDVVVTTFNAVVEDAHPFCVGYTGRMM